MIGKLIIVGSPIGNLGDVSPNLLRYIKDATVLAVENPFLFDQFCKKIGATYSAEVVNIEYKDRSLEQESLNYLIEKIRSGVDVTVVSDEGMPSIADPGNLLIDTAISDGIEIVCTPGPSSIIPAVIMSGSYRRFTFEGFLPINKEERLITLKELQGSVRPIIFLMQNIEKNNGDVVIFSDKFIEFFDEAVDNWGENRKATLCFDLTTDRQKVLRHSLGEFVDYFKNNPRISGNACIVIDGTITY